MREIKFTAYTTKYALTEGVRVAEVSMRHEGSSMVSTGSFTNFQHFHREGHDWQRTMESAISRCEQMREAKIKSHEKAIKNLKALKF